MLTVELPYLTCIYVEPLEDCPKNIDFDKSVPSVSLSILKYVI